MSSCLMWPKVGVSVWSDEQNLNQLRLKVVVRGWPKHATNCLLSNGALVCWVFWGAIQWWGWFWRRYCLCSSCDWHFNNMIFLALLCHFLATTYCISIYLTLTSYFQMTDVNKDFKSIFSRCKVCKLCHNIWDVSFLTVYMHCVRSQSDTDFISLCCLEDWNEGNNASTAWQINL